MNTWKEFRAAAAEEITGMDMATQRVKRRRGQLTPVNDQDGKARLNAVLLGEMVLVQELSPLFVVKMLSANLTARALAASWIGYWGAKASGASAEEAAKLTGRRGKPATHLIFPTEARHWKDFIFTDDPGAALASGKSIQIAVDLKALAERITQRAGGLLENE